MQKNQQNSRSQQQKGQSSDIPHISNYQQFRSSLQTPLKQSEQQLPIPKFRKDDYNYQQIKALKSNLFKFQQSLQQKASSRPQANHKKSVNNNNVYDHKAMRPSHIPIKQACIWKPKISSKKLYQQPKFFLSMERKKIKGQISARSVSIPQPSKSGQMKGKVLSKGKFNKATANRILYKASEISNYPKNQYQQIFLQEKSKFDSKKLKPPHLNFNMHHIISKRRQNYFMQQQSTLEHSNQKRKKHSFYATVRNPKIVGKSQSTRSKSLVQGSNEPYYNFFTSIKYQSLISRVNSKSFVSLDSKSEWSKQRGDRINSAAKQSKYKYNDKYKTHPKTCRTNSTKKQIQF